jgi:hypothetical protein
MSLPGSRVIFYDASLCQTGDSNTIQAWRHVPCGRRVRGVRGARCPFDVDILAKMREAAVVREAATA